MTDQRAKVLIVDDEPVILSSVHTNLSRHGFEVADAESGEQALSILRRWHPDVVLLDLGLPDRSGMEIIRWMRERSELPPIIILSVRTGERDKVAALNLGADDYLTKPFGMDELLARIKVAIRHSTRHLPPLENLIQAGNLTIDLAHRRVTASGQEVHLTPIEWDILAILARSPDRVLTHRKLLQQIWGPEYGDEGHYLHVHVANLRRKIEPDPRAPRRLLTEPGVGHRFCLNDEI